LDIQLYEMQERGQGRSIQVIQCIQKNYLRDGKAEPTTKRLIIALTKTASHSHVYIPYIYI